MELRGTAGDPVTAVTDDEAMHLSLNADGVDYIHVHPAVPRTLRVSLIVGF